MFCYRRSRISMLLVLFSWERSIDDTRLELSRITWLRVYTDRQMLQFISNNMTATTSCHGAFTRVGGGRPAHATY